MIFNYDLEKAKLLAFELTSLYNSHPDNTIHTVVLATLSALLSTDNDAEFDSVAEAIQLMLPVVLSTKIAPGNTTLN